jgi:hypothetical protein
MERVLAERQQQREVEDEGKANAESAAFLFKFAVSKMAEPPKTDREVYDWLLENPPQKGDRVPGTAKYSGDAIPPYETWLGSLKQLRRSYVDKSRMALIDAKIALAALEAGELATAKRYAIELLENNTDRESWNYGNVLHNMNEILGRVALREGDIDSAKQFLLRAGKTPGSPSLNSFGPSLALPHELLVSGEKETVIEYLGLLGELWSSKLRQKRAEQKQALLHQWETDIRAGKIPDHRKWRGAGAL